MFTYIDLFAGAGGWSYGLAMAGWKNLGFYENNTAACTTARQNLDFEISEVDLLNWKNIEFPDVTAIIGSPPCQGFSNEGYKNKYDQRNSLVSIYLDIIDARRPEFWVFENVPGFQRLYKGQFFREFCERVSSIGYSLNTGIIDFSDFGVPQKRKRFVAIGHKKEVLPFPIPTHSTNASLFSATKKNTLWDAISDLPSVEHGERIGEFEYTLPPSTDYQVWARGNSVRVYNHTTQSHGKRILEKIASVPVGGDMRNIVEKYPENQTHYCGGYRRAVKQEPSYTAYWTRGMTSIHPEKDRFLSPRECARIQSFRDSVIFRGATIENYTQICNAVPPLFAETLGNHLNAVIGGISEDNKAVHAAV
jgi:DNA (cytosine-5)-methyltransferase 1